MTRHLTGSPREYFRSPAPSPLDAEIREIVRSGKRTDETEGWFLLAFASRMAALAVRENNPAHLRDAIAALALEGGRIDAREHIQILALIHHSARKLSADAAELFGSASASGNQDLDDAIRGFPARPPADQTIEAMGFREVSDEDGFRYERLW